jgi:predicted DNA-binding antitoxin AbrB/MazE fold protein
MTQTLEAVYEGGVLKLPRPLPLPEKARVFITVESVAPAEDRERAAWLKLSEDALTGVWDNEADDVFNELRPR